MKSVLEPGISPSQLPRGSQLQGENTLLRLAIVAIKKSQDPLYCRRAGGFLEQNVPAFFRGFAE